jgi:Na+/proline symporter
LALLIRAVSTALQETLMEAWTIWVSVMAIVGPTFLIGILNSKCASGHALVGLILGGIVTLLMNVWYIHSRSIGEPISWMLIQVPGAITVIICGILGPVFLPMKNRQDKIKGLCLWPPKKPMQV